MTFEDFVNTLDDAEPPSGVPALVKALWHEKNDDWHQAHKIAQSVPTSEGSWVHAHLHRVEGDLGNARYWYSRAGRPESQAALEDEWEEIIRELLAE